MPNFVTGECNTLCHKGGNGQFPLYDAAVGNYGSHVDHLRENVCFDQARVNEQLVLPQLFKALIACSYFEFLRSHQMTGPCIRCMYVFYLFSQGGPFSNEADIQRGPGLKKRYKISL